MHEAFKGRGISEVRGEVGNEQAKQCRWPPMTKINDSDLFIYSLLVCMENSTVIYRILAIILGQITKIINVM